MYIQKTVKKISNRLFAQAHRALFNYTGGSEATFAHVYEDIHNMKRHRRDGSY